MRISRRKKHNVKPSKTYFRHNERIRDPEVRVINEDGEHLDVMPTEQARALAAKAGLDLVEINPASRPPICKIMEYGQFKYQQEKLAKQQKARQKDTGVKGVRLSARIGQHDLEIRKKQAVKFLNAGHNVRIEIILRGREKGHQEISYNIIKEFIKDLELTMDLRVEQPPKRQGSKIATIVVKTGDKKVEKTKEEELERSENENTEE